VTLRLAESLLVIGTIVLIISFTQMTYVHSNDDMEQGIYAIYLITVNTDIYVTLSVHGNDSVSFYLLDFEEGIKVVKEGSLENATPLLSFEQISSFADFIDLPADGSYVFVVAPTESNSTRIWVELNILGPVPHPRPFFTSLVIIALGVITYLSSRSQVTFLRKLTRTED
jgi:hypothetical protein